MPSLLHEALLELFRNRPRLAPELLDELGVKVPKFTKVRLESIDFTQITPTEYRADLVVVLHRRRKPVMATVVDAQRPCRSG